MPTTPATFIDNSHASTPSPAWSKNAIVITTPEVSLSKQPEATLQENAQSSDITSEELTVLNKLIATPSGTWFEYKINGCNKKRQIKFSWYSPTTRSYIFVGPNGIQVACLPERTLAHDIYVGNARILEHTGTSFISHILNIIYKKLKQAVGAAQTIETSRHSNHKHKEINLH